MSTTTIDTVKVQAYLVKLFSKVLTEDDIVKNRGRAYAMLSNYESPTSKTKVAEILSEEERGEVLNTILIAHSNARINSLAKRMATEDTGGF